MSRKNRFGNSFIIRIFAISPPGLPICGRIVNLHIGKVEAGQFLSCLALDVNDFHISSSAEKDGCAALGPDQARKVQRSVPIVVSRVLVRFMLNQEAHERWGFEECSEMQQRLPTTCRVLHRRSKSDS
jgi:hypothetical protein